MLTNLGQELTSGLERLCGANAAGAHAPDAVIRAGEGGDGIERVEAYFSSGGFSPHRHDTYAIGVTLSGLQTFSYRGEQRYCLPGQCHILHPDEPHDGRAGADGGFRYRIAYIDPCLIQLAIGGQALPFVEDPVVTLSPMQQSLLAAAWDMTNRVDGLRQAEIASAVAEALESLSAPGERKAGLLHLDALLRVRNLLAASPARQRSAAELERLAGLDRWTLARQFRPAFGTSPTRFRTMRQLHEVRRLASQGMSLAEASLQAGFADQSHMSRQFKRAYGLTPQRWVRLTSTQDH